MSPLLDLVALVYLVAALFVGVRLYRNRRAAFDARFTQADRRLVGAASFYLLVPFAVALHELGHAALTWAYGGKVQDFHFMVYWGWVLPARVPDFAPLEYAAIAAAGNLVTLALAAAAIVWTMRRPGNAAFNFLRLEFARILLGLELIFYPLGSMLLHAGDFWIMREQLNAAAAPLGDATLVAYGLVALTIWWLWKRGPWGPIYARMTSPFRDAHAQLQQRVIADPSNTAAQQALGVTKLASGDPPGALAIFEALVNAGVENAELDYLAGAAAMECGDPIGASTHFRRGGLRPVVDDLQQRSLLIGLARARLALDDAAGAAITAGEALKEAPHDPIATLVLADALTADGRPAEAAASLEQALEVAEGPLAVELRRRIEALPPS